MESPYKLVEYVLETIKQIDDETDAILLNGDFVGHGIAIKNPWDADHATVWEK